MAARKKKKKSKPKSRSRKKAKGRKAATRRAVPPLDGPNAFGGFTYVDKTGKVAKITVDATGEQGGKEVIVSMTIDDPVQDQAYELDLAKGLYSVAVLGGYAAPVSGYGGTNQTNPAMSGEGFYIARGEVRTELKNPANPDQGIRTLTDADIQPDE